MKHRVIVEYDYPVEHKPPVKADIYLHGDKVTTGNIKPLQAELEEIKTEIQEFLATEGFSYDDYKGITLLLEKHIKELNNDL